MLCGDERRVERRYGRDPDRQAVGVIAGGACRGSRRVAGPRGRSRWRGSSPFVVESSEGSAERELVCVGDSGQLVVDWCAVERSDEVEDETAWLSGCSDERELVPMFECEVLPVGCGREAWELAQTRTVPRPLASGPVTEETRVILWSAWRYESKSSTKLSTASGVAWTSVVAEAEIVIGRSSLRARPCVGRNRVARTIGRSPCRSRTATR